MLHLSSAYVPRRLKILIVDFNFYFLACPARCSNVYVHSKMFATRNVNNYVGNI